MIKRRDEVKAVEMAQGVLRKTLAVGERMMIAEFSLKTNAKVSLHQHSHEQVGYIVLGSLRMNIGDQVHLLAPGDSYFIPGGTPHGAEVMADSVVLDIFSPPREDYLP